MRLYVFHGVEEEYLLRTKCLSNDREVEERVVRLSEGELGDELLITALILCDVSGIRCIWRRTADEARRNGLPPITRVAERYGGEWRRDVSPVSTIEPTDPRENNALAHHRSA